MAVFGFTRSLTWNDYPEVDTSPNGKHDAQTGILISYSAPWQLQGSEWSIITDKVSVSVNLNPKTTWVVKGRQTNALLDHEQAHYDIAAVAARTLESELKGLSGTIPKSSAANPRKFISGRVSRKVTEIVGDVTADGRVITAGALQRVQDRYDDDLTCGSAHGVNKMNQGQWELRISKAFGDASISVVALDSCPLVKGAASGE